MQNDQWRMQNRIEGGAGLFFFLSLSIFLLSSTSSSPSPSLFSIDAPAVGGLEPPKPPVDPPLGNPYLSDGCRGTYVTLLSVNMCMQINKSI